VYGNQVAQLTSIEGFKNGASVGTQSTLPDVFTGGVLLTITLDSVFNDVDRVIITGTSFSDVFDDFVFETVTAPSDTTAPRVTSVLRQTPSTSLTRADTLVFRVTFDEPVQNVDAADFDALGTSGDATSVSPVSTTV
jgi:hypothetical protein